MELIAKKIFFRNQKLSSKLIQILRIEICESINLIDFRF